MAVFLLNTCKFNACGLSFPTLQELIYHIEDKHLGTSNTCSRLRHPNCAPNVLLAGATLSILIFSLNLRSLIVTFLYSNQKIDSEPRNLEEMEFKQTACLPVSYIFRLFSGDCKNSSTLHNPLGDNSAATSVPTSAHLRPSLPARKESNGTTSWMNFTRALISSLFSIFQQEVKWMKKIMKANRKKAASTLGPTIASKVTPIPFPSMWPFYFRSPSPLLSVKMFV